jgi:AcrR family transcriptional regulator
MPPGRPRKFNADEVLERAMEVFWRRGFRGTSLNELARELGIEKPSLYAAFGNKEQLFLKALDRYASGFGRRAVLLLQETPSGKAAIEALLSAFAAQLADADSPAGCMIANCAVECRDLSASINRELVEWLEATEKAILDRLKRARKEGDLAPAKTSVRSRVTSPPSSRVWSRYRALTRREGAPSCCAHRASRLARACCHNWANDALMDCDGRGIGFESAPTSSRLRRPFTTTDSDLQQRMHGMNRRPAAR